MRELVEVPQFFPSGTFGSGQHKLPKACQDDCLDCSHLCYGIDKLSGGMSKQILDQ